MRTAGQWRRRRFLAWCMRTVAFLPAILTRAAPEPTSRNVVSQRSARRVVRYQRHFRAQAAVLVLGIPIFRRDDVGAGCATVELGSQYGDTISALQFAAGSRPERARGMNRFGALLETAVETSGRLATTVGVGFITSSSEKTLDEARTALHSAGPVIPCAFSSSSSGVGRTEVRKGRFMASGAASWADAPGILTAAQQESGPSMLSETQPIGPVATFLYAIRQASLNPAPRTHTQFCHNGEFCELVTARGSIAAEPAESPARMNGVILDRSGLRKSEFTIWIDPHDPSGLPTRIEFNARSYLRLTFQAQPPSEAETLPWLLKEEPV